ncbi:AGE family epimerase/isomerase [Marinimicrobium sp. LS-A18]|uniref:AGE family epimerase/isomerase n=1 Tax=Marinimicrobium sp. LS-A18 TaxID=1381596 RepID=UPI0004BCF160|nr:AGE family epimerase/isomerase [Marinimicrobium sp. LS-A18]
MALYEPAVKSPLSELSQEFRSELLSIADWWLAYAQDQERGGFYGEVGVDNVPVPHADKGVVLNTRILWFFSELASEVDDPRYREAAERGYRYLLAHFLDKAHGGFFWTLDADGAPKDTKKQVYAQAFAIYALVAYYQLTGEPLALQQAQQTFDLLERHTVDPVKGGYLEAFNRQWGALDDVRLSDKDLNFPKTMNTHLHVVEAYTTLHQVDARASVADALRYAIDCFDRHIINKDNFHLRMFMDHDWQDHSPGYTYGHDIECSWLLAKATESLADAAVSERLKPSVLGIADVCLREAMGEHGEMYDGFEFATQAFNHERVWWVQAEAMVGYYKAYTLSGNEDFLATTERLWSFIKRYHRAENGEWLWLSTLDDQSLAPSYKLGPWKGPYHNGRAMLEMLRLLQ